MQSERARLSISRIVIPTHTIRILVRGAELVIGFHVIDSRNSEVGTMSEDGILSESEDMAKKLDDRVFDRN